MRTIAKKHGPEEDMGNREKTWEPEGGHVD